MDRASNVQEINQIRDDLEKYYVRGHSDYNPDLYREILHPEWKMFQLEEGVMRLVDRDEFCTWYEPEKRNPDLFWEFEILRVDVMGDTAQVKLRLENQRVLYTDYLQMMKITGKWWIVHKIYHQIDKV